MGCVKLGLTWVFLPHIKPLIVEPRTLNTWQVRFEGIFAIKSTWLAQVSIPPHHSLCSCPTWFCCDSNWGDEEEGLLALSWSWRVQDFEIHLIPWFSSSPWTKPVWGCLERIQSSHFPECPPWSPRAQPWSCGRSQTSYRQAELGIKPIFPLPWGSFCLFVLKKRWNEEQEAPWENSWVRLHSSSRTHDRSEWPQLEVPEDISWQQFLTCPEPSDKICVIIFCIYLCESLPHWFPTSFCLPNRKHLDSFCWMKMFPFEEGGRVKYTNEYPENTN